MPERLLFDDYQLDPASGELFMAGRRVALQPQPARLLSFLARRAPQVVSREELRRHLWPERTYVDFDQGLNFAIKQIRRTLADSADSPRFVETVHRFGYRFLREVRVVSAAFETSPPPGPVAAGRPLRRGGPALLLLTAAVLSTVGDRPRKNGGAGLKADPQSQPTYLTGRYLLAQPEASARRRGLALIETVIASAPRYGPAQALFALAKAEGGGPLDRTLEPAQAAAERALALEPGLAEAHLALARLALYYRFDLELADAEVDRALQAAPRLAQAHLARARNRAAEGRHDEAIEAAERALALEPESLLVRADVPWFYYLARRYDEAARQAEALLRLEPRNGAAHTTLLWASIGRGDPATALSHAAAIRDAIEPRSQRRLTFPEFWDWQLSRVRRAPEGAVSPAHVALVMAARGEADKAVDLLERACQQRYGGFVLPFAAVDPRLDPVRAHPRFGQVLSCVGVGPRLQSAGRTPAPAPTRLVEPVPIPPAVARANP